MHVFYCRTISKMYFCFPKVCEKMLNFSINHIIWELIIYPFICRYPKSWTRFLNFLKARKNYFYFHQFWVLLFLVYDAGENPILEARLAIPAMETQTNNPIAFILSSESTSSSFVMDINKTQTADKQTDFRGNRCHFTTSSTTVGNTFRYNARTSCPDKVSSYFKPILSKRGKGVLSFEEIDELKEKKYFNSTTSNDGTEASFSINPIGMLVDGIKMESLKFQILTISKNELDLVAFNVWSFDIV